MAQIGLCGNRLERNAKLTSTFTSDCQADRICGVSIAEINYRFQLASDEMLDISRLQCIHLDSPENDYEP